jgi:hypothetical protein
VYNVELEAEHHFFVGKTGVLVHNGYAVSAQEALEQGLSIVPKPRTAYLAGEQLGREDLLAQGYKDAGWLNPFADRGAYGQGFDDVLAHPTLPDNYVIVDYKGGTGALAPGQMGPYWVRGNIELLRTDAAWSPWGATLQEALDSGQLHGIVVSTPTVNGTAGATVITHQFHY